jgi:hypothetical protein
MQQVIKVNSLGAHASSYVSLMRAGNYFAVRRAVKNHAINRNGIVRGLSG